MASFWVGRKIRAAEGLRSSKGASLRVDYHSLVGMRSVAWRSGLSSPAGCPTARMFTGTKVSGPNSRMTVGSKRQIQTLPRPKSVAASIMWSVRMDASTWTVLMPSSGRFHAFSPSAHDECERRVEHVRGFRQAGEPFLAGHLEDAHRLAVRGGRRDAGRFDDGVDVLLADGDGPVGAGRAATFGEIEKRHGCSISEASDGSFFLHTTLRFLRGK